LRLKPSTEYNWRGTSDLFLQPWLKMFGCGDLSLMISASPRSTRVNIDGVRNPAITSNEFSIIDGE
jgi:hypothetical protein